MDALKRKLGPLQLWQWVLIGAVLGGGVLLWRRGHPAAAAAAGAVPSDAQYQPIDPTTGLPYAGGVTPASPAEPTPAAPTPASLDDLLGQFGQLEELLAGLQALQPGAAIETDMGAVHEQTGTGPARQKPGPLERAKKAVTSGRLGPVNRDRLRRAGYTDAQINYHLRHGTPLGAPKGEHGTGKGHKTRHPRHSPGHTEISHGPGKVTRRSAAPHNPRQQGHTQPPAHERHEPTRHPSAQHPSSPPPHHGHRGKHRH